MYNQKILVLYKIEAEFIFLHRISFTLCTPSLIEKDRSAPLDIYERGFDFGSG